MARHPSAVSKRLIALAPQLAPAPSSVRLRRARPVFAAIVVFLVGGLSMGRWLPSLRGQARVTAASDPTKSTAQARKDLGQLRALIEADLRAGRQLPWDVWELYGRWADVHGKDSGPTDPFSGYWYDYDQRGGAYRLWSTGPDATNRTSDDIVVDSRTARKSSVPAKVKVSRRAPPAPPSPSAHAERGLD